MKFINGVPDYVLHWEAYDQLYYKGEFEALIVLQKKYVKQHPGNYREKLLLADAYSYAGKYGVALKILKRLHKFNPYDTEFTHAIVECLYKLEKDPKTFKWEREVIIFEGKAETTDWCYAYLSKEGASDDAYNMLFEMEVAGYARFEEDALINFLKSDCRFRVHEIEDEDYPVIELSEWALIELAN